MLKKVFFNISLSEISELHLLHPRADRTDDILGKTEGVMSGRAEHPVGVLCEWVMVRRPLDLYSGWWSGFCKVPPSLSTCQKYEYIVTYVGHRYYFKGASTNKSYLRLLSYFPRDHHGGWIIIFDLAHIFTSYIFFWHNPAIHRVLRPAPLAH